MRYHEILGITENATLAEIEEAYARRILNLNKQKDLLPAESVEIKQTELLTAKDACITWANESSIEHIKEQLQENTRHSTNSVRLNAMCCGPVTCMDMLAGEVLGFLCCSDPTPLSEICFDSQAITILCDLGLYGLGAWTFYSDYQEKEAAKERQARIERSQKARADNAALNTQLSQCLSNQRKLLDQVNNEQNKARSVEAFVTLFTALGAKQGHEIVDKQHAEIKKAQSVLNTNQAKEAELRKKIQDNQDIINSSH